MVVVWPASALDTDCVIEGVRAVMICCTRDASLVLEEDCWAFMLVTLFWLLPWKLLLLPWKLEVVVLLPCSAVAASTADVMEGPRALRTDSTTWPWLTLLLLPNLEALLLPREEPAPNPELESPLLLPKPELERPLLPKPESPLLPRREELPKPLLPKVEPVRPVPPMVELEKLLSLEEEELEELHLDWLFTPLEVPENWTEVAGPLVTDP